jgi:hypothetical protein
MRHPFLLGSVNGLQLSCSKMWAIIGQMKLEQWAPLPGNG